MTDIELLRRDLAAAFVLADRLGFSEGICNHFSAVVPGEQECYLINPFGVHWSEMRPDHLLLIDRAGWVRDGTVHCHRNRGTDPGWITFTVPGTAGSVFCPRNTTGTPAKQGLSR